MKAVQINQYGGAEVFEVNPDVAEPVAGKWQVLVKVSSSSINPFDIKLASGMFKEQMPLKFPATMGGDFAGVVKAVGEGVTAFKIGDEVYGSATVLGGGTGAWAELVAASASHTAVKPKTTSLLETGGLPLVGVSAVQALIEYLNLQAGQRIFITGGVGGIGSMAIQLAKALGTYVATTIGSDDRVAAKELGADEAFDYKEEDFTVKLKDYDAVFDTVGGDETNKALKVLRSGGKLVTMIGQVDEVVAKTMGVEVTHQGTQINTERLIKLATYVDGGKVKVQIAKVFKLEQISEACEFQKNGHPKGKVVITIS